MTQETGRKFRVVVAAPAYRTDKLFYPNEPGAKVVAAALRDAGFDVIDTDLDQTPETIANAALQHSADAVYISVDILHFHPFREILDCLKEGGLSDVLLLGGAGMFSELELHALQKLGFGRIFGPGNGIQDVVAYLREEIPRRRPARP
jgi:methylmalonyl-CoA mutase C-terminal domain/subunit